MGRPSNDTLIGRDIALRTGVRLDEPKTRPILFSGPMVIAILDGRKTQTRRIVVRTGRDWDSMEPLDGYPGEWATWLDGERYESMTCRHGQPGDRLWVRETIGVTAAGACFYDADHTDVPVCPLAGLLCERYGSERFFAEVRRISSIHMPRWASRITLEITDVSAQRLQEISEEDAKAEGAMFHDGRGVGHSGWRHIPDGPVYTTARESFRALWDSLNAARGYPWMDSPWTWAITFRCIEQARRAA